MTASMFKCPFNIEHGVVAMLGRGRERRSELGFNHLKTLKGPGPLCYEIGGCKKYFF